jgi:CxxC-x17-CxxC domain-containing protein
MKIFNKSKDFGGDRQAMYQAVCANCGKNCEVPFRPSGDKPVYCSDCFGKGGKTPKPPSNLGGHQFDLLNAKLDKILQVLSANQPISTSKPASAPAKAKEKKPAVKKPKAVKKSKVKKSK